MAVALALSLSIHTTVGCASSTYRGVYPTYYRSKAGLSRGIKRAQRFQKRFIKALIFIGSLITADQSEGGIEWDIIFHQVACEEDGLCVCVCMYVCVCVWGVWVECT